MGLSGPDFSYRFAHENKLELIRNAGEFRQLTDTVLKTVKQDTAGTETADKN